MSVFTPRNIGKGELLRSEYGTLVYTGLGRKNQYKKTYREGIIGPTVADFHELDLNMDKRVEHCTIGTLPTYTVSAKFCSMRFINDPYYRDADKQKGSKEKVTVVMAANVHLIEAYTWNNARDLYDVSSMTMLALRNIEEGEGLFEKYPKAYSFPVPNRCCV